MRYTVLMEALALPADPTPSLDERVLLYDVCWEDYERLLAMRGERSVPRITYLEGTLELMSPSIDHEYIKTNIARILEAWALQRRVRLNGFGSWTLKRRRVKRGAEPDECYVLGPARKRKPDLAIEVVWTHGGLDKLEVYRRLGVGELWIWEHGRIDVYVLNDSQYVQATRSLLLPEMDLELLARFAIVTDQLDAVEGFLAAIGARG